MLLSLESGWAYNCFNQEAKIKVTLYAFWVKVIESHVASDFFSGGLNFGAPRLHVKIWIPSQHQIMDLQADNVSSICILGFSQLS